MDTLSTVLSSRLFLVRRRVYLECTLKMFTVETIDILFIRYVTSTRICRTEYAFNFHLDSLVVAFYLRVKRYNEIDRDNLCYQSVNTVLVDRRSWSERCGGRASCDGQTGLQRRVAEVSESRNRIVYTLRGVQGSRLTVQE